MATRETPWPAGTPCWADLSVPDVAAATAFYSAVVGWTFVDTGEQYGHYAIGQTAGKAAAAVGPLMQEGQPTAWTVYLASDDADATAKLIADNGGTVLADPMDIPGNGRMAVALDASGAAFGLWQADGMIGFEIANEPGSVVWTDALLTDPGAGRDFYAAVFGYTYQPVPGAPGDYGTFSVGGDVAGGLGGAPGGAPGHWLPYFAVPDVDAAVAVAVGAGASVFSPAEDTPFDRMGTLTDPFGAVFALHGPNVGEAVTP